MEDEAALTWKGTDRFQPLGVLGQGGHGAVLRAFDQQSQEEVAIKVLRERSANALRRFRAEFDAVANITHRNLVSLYELNAKSAPWFLVMELVRGTPLLDRSASTDGETRTIFSQEEHFLEPPELGSATSVSSGVRAATTIDSVERLATLFLQLCDGLEALHSRSILHLDLKPANVWVETTTDRVVLLDLGLAHGVNDASFLLAGTPAYLAPELLAKERPTTASDCYAVGVLLFEAIARRWPFSGSMAQILASKRQEKPPSTRDFSGSLAVPEELEQLCRRLLDPVPDRRPALAEVRNVLLRLLPEEVRNTGKSREEIALTALPAHTEIFVAASRPLVGAEATQLLLLLSKPGLGRSSLLELLRHRLHRAGETVLLVRCSPNARVDYRLFDAVLRGCLQRVASTTATRALDALFTAERVEERERLLAIEALAEVFSRLLMEGPTTICIDDAHWSDAESLELLDACLNRYFPGLRLVFAAREDAEQVEPLRRALAAIPGTHFEELELRRLPLSDAELLVGALAPKLRVSDQRRLAEVSEGIPWAIVRLVQAIGGEGETPATLPLAITRMLGNRTRTELEVLLVLTVACGSLSELSLSEAMEDPRGYRRAVHSLVLDGWVYRFPSLDDEGSLAIAHEAIAEAVLVREYSLVGARIERLRSVLLETKRDPLALARMLETDGRRKEAAELWEREALAAQRVGDFVVARERAGRAVELSEQRSARIQRLELLGALDVALGRTAVAADEFLSAARLAESVSKRQMLGIRAAEQLLASGRYAEGRALLQTLVAAEGGALPSVPSPINTGKLLLKRVGKSSASIVLQAGLVYVAGLGLLDPMAAFGVHLQNIRLAELLGDDAALLRALSMQVLFDGAIGAVREAPAFHAMHRVSILSARLAERASEEGIHRALQAHVDGLRGTYLVQRGYFAEGIVLLQRCEDRRTSADPWTWDRTVLSHFLLWGLFYSGQFRSLSRLATALSWRANRYGDRYAVLDFRTQHMVCAALLADDPKRAEAQLEEALSLAGFERGELQKHDEIVAKTELCLYRGQAKDALELLIKNWGVLPTKELLLPEGVRIDSLVLRLRVASSVLAESPNTWAARLMFASAIYVLQKESASWVQGFCSYFSAVDCLQSENREKAIGLLKVSTDHFIRFELRAFAACSQALLEQLLGTKRKDAGLETATEFFRSEGARNEWAFLRLFLPGGAP